MTKSFAVFTFAILLFFLAIVAVIFLSFTIDSFIQSVYSCKVFDNGRYDFNLMKPLCFGSIEPTPSGAT